MKTVAPVRPVLPFGGRAIPEPSRFLLQERTPDGEVVREFEHRAARCAMDELWLLNNLQPERYQGGRVLVVVAPDGAVIAHTGTPADLLPEWSVVEPSLLSVGSALIGGAS